MVLIENYFPNFATETRQAAIVDAPAAVTFDAIRETDFSRSWLVLALARIRELPDRALRRLRGETQRRRAAVTIGALVDAGYWLVLDEQRGRELLLGLSM